MEKRTLIALAIFVLLGIGGYAAMRAPEKGERRGPPPRPFPAIKAADITGLETTNQKGEKTTLARKDGTWRITSPGDYAADQGAVKTLTDGIEKLTFGDVVTENPAKQDELEVGDKGSVRLKIITTAQSPEVLLGKPVSGFGMLRVAGKNEIWQSGGLMSFQANKATKDWRDHTVIPVVATATDKLTVEVPGGSKLVVARDAGTADATAKKPSSHWKIVESTGDAPKAGQAFDESQPQTVLQAMQGLRADEFADGKSAQEAGLDKPQMLITATSGGKDQTLEIGAQKGEDVYVRARGAAPIYLVKRYLLERLSARPIDYRDKTLAHVKAEDLTHMRVVQGKDTTDLTQKDGKWTLTSGGALDEKKVKAFAGGVDSLYGSSFVTDKAAKTGLDAPKATITIEQKSGPKIVLKVGSVTADGGDYYVTAAGSKDVFVAKKFALDRLLKKPADFAPAPPKK